MRDDRKPIRRAGAARADARPAPSMAKKNSRFMLWLGLGGGAAAIALVVLVVVLSGKGEPPAPVAAAPESAQVVLSGADPVPVFTESELLQLHSGSAPAPRVLPKDTPVTVHGQLRTDRDLYYLARPATGPDVWVSGRNVKANFDLAGKTLMDYRGDWSIKAEAYRKVARAAEGAKAAAPPKPVEAPKPTVEPPKPAEAPKPEPKPAAEAPTPEEPAKPEPAAPQEKADAVGVWKFDEKDGTRAADESGAANDGKLTGGVARVAGPGGGALQFDGVDDYVACSVAGLPAAKAPQTLSLWFSVAAIPSGNQPMVSLTNDAAASGVQLGFRGGRLTVWRPGGTVLAASEPPKAGDAWHHAAYTWDGTSHKLYLDGALAGTTTVMPSTASPAKLEIGRWGSPVLSEYFKGKLDEVRIYARALSPDEVKELAPPSAEKAPGPTAGPKPAPGPGPRPPPGVKPPRPPADPSDPKAAAREEKAKALFEAAEQLEKAGQLADAQAKYREVNERFRSTAFWFENMNTIRERIREIGTKLALASLDKSAPYRKPHMDSWYGYEFQPPDGWRGVPPWARYFGDDDTSEVGMGRTPLRTCQYTSKVLETLRLKVFKIFQATSADDVERRVFEYHKQRFPGLEEVQGSRQDIKSRQPTARRTYVSKAGDRMVIYPWFAEKRGLALVGYWLMNEDENDSWTIIISSGSGSTVLGGSSKIKPIEPADFEHAAKVFDQTAKSFWIYDQPTKAGRETMLNNGALCSDWNALVSPKGLYSIEYGTRPEFAKRVAAELEGIQALYRSIIPTGKGIPRCKVKVFDTEDDFQYYGQAYGAAAYWSPSHEEIVCYRFQGDKVKDDSKEEFTIAEERNPEEVTFGILYHEGFHQYMYYLMGRDRMVYVPSWLNEGMGDYFFGGRWKQGKFVIGPNDWRLKRIWDAVKAGKHVPLDQLIRYTQMQYYANATLCYAEGWALNYFFMSDVGRKKGYYVIPQRMFDELKKSGDFTKATDNVFRGLNLKAMEEEWKEFVLGLIVEKPGDKKE